MEAEELRGWLAAAGLSSYRFAKVLGRTPSTVSDWVRAKSPIPHEMFLTIRGIEEEGLIPMEHKAVLFHETEMPINGIPTKLYLPEPPAEGTGQPFPTDLDWQLNSYGRLGWRVASHATASELDHPAIRVIFSRPRPAGVL